MKDIETGVDKLVSLIEEKKRISLEDAAKKLGVSKVLVQEWADFLEQDGLISVEYSLSKVWLVERKLTKSEVQKKTKEYTDRKDSFLRKVETTLQSLDKDTTGFEKMKKEFKDLKGEIGGEINSVRKDFEELEYYEKLKDNIDKDIEKQKSEYQKLMEQSHQEIKAEERRYREMVAQVEQEKSKVQKDRESVKSMEEKEKELEKRVKDLNKLVNDMRSEIRKEEKDLDVSEANVKKLEDFVDQVEQRLKHKKHQAILPLIKLSEDHSSKIVNLQEQILEKLKKKKQEIDSYKGQKKKVYKDLKKFFDKKSKAEKLLKDIDKKKENLKKEYDQLMKKAQAFNAINKDETVKKQMAELEKEYKKVEGHKAGLKDEIKRLTKLIKG